MRFRCLEALLVLLAVSHAVAAQECNQSLADYLSGSDTWFMDLGLQISGFANSLPNPGTVPVTLLIPTNGAWSRFAWNNGLLFGVLDRLGSTLTSVVTYMVFPVPLSPDDLQTPGDTQTLYGLLNGTNEPLHHWVQDGQILFQGYYDPKIAGVSEHYQVCNSHIYIVDEVLRPTYDLRDLKGVNIPDLSSLGLGGSSPAAPAPDSSSSSSDGSSNVTDASAGASNSTDSSSSSSNGCNTTLSQAASQQGLTLLSTVLGQSAIAGQLPDPSQNLTVFLPTNAAFFALLSTFNLSISDALTMGDKLGGLLAYHMVPGALTPDALSQRDSLDTVLGQRMGGGYILGVSQQGDQTVISGVYPGNRAKVTSSLTICNTQAYVIDQVLIPADSLEALPVLGSSTNSSNSSSSDGNDSSIAPAPAPAPESSQPAEAPSESNSSNTDANNTASASSTDQSTVTSISGVALATGHLAGCTVQLQSANVSNTATTDDQGRFTIDCGDGGCAQLQNASLVMPADGQPNGCKDSLTGEGLPFSLGALLLPANLTSSSPGGSSNSSNGSSTDSSSALVTVSPLTSVVAAQLTEGTDAASLAQQDYTLLEQVLGLPNASVAAFGDPLQGAQGNDSAAINVLVSSQQLLTLLSVGGQAVAGQTANATLDEAVQVLSRAVLAAAAAGQLNLTSSDGVAQLLQASQQALAASIGSTVEVSMSSISNRRMLLRTADRQLQQDGSSSGGGDNNGTTSSSSGSGNNTSISDNSLGSPSQQEVQAAVANVITILSGLLDDAYAAWTAGRITDSSKLLEVVARAVKVALANAAPAAAQLAAGQLSLSDFDSQFGQDGLAQLISQASLA